MPAERSRKVRVMIADDQKLILQGLATLLGQQNDDFDILPGASDGAQAIEFARRYRPDVILMDLQMPRVDGVTATRRILSEFPQTSVVVLTTFETDSLIFDAVSAGAKAYLLKDAAVQEIATTIRAVTEGKSALSPGVAARLLGEFKRLRQHRVPELEVEQNLTSREKEIARLIAEGRSNMEISNHLRLAEGTVKNYVSAIMEKYGVRNRTELAVKALGIGGDFSGSEK